MVLRSSMTSAEIKFKKNKQLFVNDIKVTFKLGTIYRLGGLDKIAKNLLWISVTTCPP